MQSAPFFLIQFSQKNMIRMYIIYYIILASLKIEYLFFWFAFCKGLHWQCYLLLIWHENFTCSLCGDSTEMVSHLSFTIVVLENLDLIIVLRFLFHDHKFRNCFFILFLFWCLHDPKMVTKLSSCPPFRHYFGHVGLLKLHVFKGEPLTMPFVWFSFTLTLYDGLKLNEPRLSLQFLIYISFSSSCIGRSFLA